MKYFDEDFAKSLPDDWPHMALMISDKLESILNSESKLAMVCFQYLLILQEQRDRNMEIERVSSESADKLVRSS